MTKRKFDVDSGLESHNKSRRDLNTLNSNSTMTAHATANQPYQTYLAAAQDLDKDELVHCLVMAQLKLDDRDFQNTLWTKTIAQKTKVIHRLKREKQNAVISLQRCVRGAQMETIRLGKEIEKLKAENQNWASVMEIATNKIQRKYNELEANYFELCCDNEKLKEEIDKDDDEPRCDFCNRTHDEVMYEDNEEDAWDGDTGCCKKCQDDS
tara:strand:- start:166 stop:795 length:630 start_codon:yes stop_codon:yes gene_type:complete